MSDKIITPKKQIVSPGGQTMSSRPVMTDQQAIDRHLGGYFDFLRMIGVPTPSKAEARNLLYSELYVKYMQEIQRQQRAELEKLQQNLGVTKQAVQLLDEMQKYKVDIGKVLADAKQKQEDDQNGIAQAETVEAPKQEVPNVEEPKK